MKWNTISLNNLPNIIDLSHSAIPDALNSNNLIERILLNNNIITENDVLIPNNVKSLFDIIKYLLKVEKISYNSFVENKNFIKVSDISDNDKEVLNEIHQHFYAQQVNVSAYVNEIKERWIGYFEQKKEDSQLYKFLWLVIKYYFDDFKEDFFICEFNLFLLKYPQVEFFNRILIDLKEITLSKKENSLNKAGLLNFLGSNPLTDNVIIDFLNSQKFYSNSIVEIKLENSPNHNSDIIICGHGKADSDKILTKKGSESLSHLISKFPENKERNIYILACASDDLVADSNQIKNKFRSILKFNNLLIPTTSNIIFYTYNLEFLRNRHPDKIFESCRVIVQIISKDYEGLEII